MVLLQDMTRATGLGFCISQLPIFIFVMLYYPEPHATVYTTKITNATTLDNHVTADEYGFSVFFLVVSALVVVFSMMTTQLQDAQFIDNMTEFTDEAAAQVYTWSSTLWGIVLLSRLNMITLLCSPSDLYFIFLVVFSQTYAVQIMCAPKVSGKRSDTLSIIMYMMVVGLVYVEMQSKHGLKVIFWTAQIMADVLLMIGHTYDSHSNTETVANCRVFYCCFVSALDILLYIA